MDDNLQIDDGNFTRVHNRILEELAKIQLSGHEIRIVFALWRKTYGWQKKEDFISVSQFQEMTGLNKVRISETIRKLKERNLVTENRNPSSVVYGFNKHFTTWKKLRKSVTVTENRNGSYGKTEEVLRKTVTEKRRDSDKKIHHETPKETLTKETITKEINTSASNDNLSNLKLSPKINFNFETEEWENIIAKNMQRWQDTYPACDINLELKKMADWLLANPAKRKKNYRKFISGWLSRQQDRGGTKFSGGRNPIEISDDSITKKLKRGENA